MARISTELHPIQVPIRISQTAYELMEAEAKRKAMPHSLLLRSWIEEYCRKRWPEFFEDDMPPMDKAVNA